MNPGEVQLTQLGHWLASAKRIFVLTGAGLSTRSGIPDYRGPQGLWRQQSPIYYEDFLNSETARLAYWDHKLASWNSFKNAQPNAAHHAVARLERAGRIHLVATQNIDGLHLRAGTSRERLVELHGTNLEVECQSCKKRSNPEPHYELFRQTRRPPRCPCGGWLKPATISFGQALNPQELERAEIAASQSDLAIALGSTLSVYPAASLPLIAARYGAKYVILNSGPTEHDSLPQLQLRIEGDVSVLFPQAVSLALDPES